MEKNFWSEEEEECLTENQPSPTDELLKQLEETQVESPRDPVPPVEEKKKKFRMNCKNFFLTFPQCPTTKEVAQSRIKEKWPEAKTLVCQELHQDGQPHLHCLLQFEKPLNIKRSDFFDFIGGQHGKYEPARNIRNSVKYITKKGDFVTNGINVEAILEKKNPKVEEVCKEIVGGSSLSDIRKDYPGFYMMHKRKLAEFEVDILMERTKKEKKTWVEFSEENIAGMSYQNQKIARWINENLFKPREFKQKQLYIYGPKNLGKSTLIMQLESYAMIYWMPASEDFYDLYDDNLYDLIVLDEFRAQKTIQQLNLWLQGSTMPLRKKGSQGLKKKNLPMIILSNYSLEECYSKTSEKERETGNTDRLDTLRTRLNIVEVGEFIQIF
ncbi:Rep [uncultured virus]|uniref:Rep n=1 Tax=uncultured virus TaxID=340016 RepID=A0A2K9LSD5_9VIRU|nr:Rep [uncultured virus]